MPQFRVTRHETFVATYTVEAATEAEAIARVKDGNSTEDGPCEFLDVVDGSYDAYLADKEASEHFFEAQPLTAPEVKAELESRFPWLLDAHQECDGADVVEALCEWHKDIAEIGTGQVAISANDGRAAAAGEQ